MQAKQPTPVRLYVIVRHCGMWGSNFLATTSDTVLTEDDAYIDTWRVKLGLIEKATCIELVQGKYQVPPKKDTVGWSSHVTAGHYTYEIANHAIKCAAAECPEGAPYGLAFLGMNDRDPGRIKVRDDIVADWRASFAAPKPEPSAIQAYIAGTKALGVARAAVAGAVERAQLEAKKVTAKGQPLSFDINTTYLDALCAALEHPERVYRATPRRADMLRRLGIVVEVVYQVPERNVYLAQAPNSRDTETDGDLYIRMRVPA